MNMVTKSVPLTDLTALGSEVGPVVTHSQPLHLVPQAVDAARSGLM
jgi:hypothetical protein